MERRTISCAGSDTRLLPILSPALLSILAGLKFVCGHTRRGRNHWRASVGARRLIHHWHRRSLDRRGTGPVLLARRHQARSSQAAESNSQVLISLSHFCAIRLHAGTTTRLAGLRVFPFKSKTKPGAVALERMIIDRDTDAGALLLHPGDLSGVGVSSPPGHDDRGMGRLRLEPKSVA